VIGSCCGEGGLRPEEVVVFARPEEVVFARVVDARLAGAVRAEGDPDRPEDPLPGGFPEAPLDVRVAMVGRLARRMVYRAETRRSGAKRARTDIASRLSPHDLQCLPLTTIGTS
jgi:hypothetical protein